MPTSANSSSVTVHEEDLVFDKNTTDVHERNSVRAARRTMVDRFKSYDCNSSIDKFRSGSMTPRNLETYGSMQAAKQAFTNAGDEEARYTFVISIESIGFEEPGYGFRAPSTSDPNKQSSYIWWKDVGLTTEFKES
ncbi:uncharacterized protein L201_000129 [Kwoniella dendrophila CBS 6074]|uniref:Uncharacterized protein n=1 Tax=Kwoniella dendrophila CBS 6074 TaxID=1295534 RepID=A0AAX4JIH9_9TREE